MQKLLFNISELPQLPAPNELFDARFIHTENMTVCFNELKAGALIPMHEHLEETIDYVQCGELKMQVAGETFIMKAGTVTKIASFVPHAAQALTDCTVINVFYPARKDFKANASQRND
jgi:quercetin dioxygenase-like cupin family protein